MEKTNKERFYEFLTENQQKFYRLAYSYVKEQEAALDVVQEAVAKALAAFDKLRQPEYMKTWFYRIIVHTAINSLKQRERYESDEEKILNMAYEEKGLLAEEKMDLYDAVMQLEEKYKTVILLRYFEDLKVQEVAKVMDIPENTAKTRIRTALNSLSGMMQREVDQ